jgi:hypothetical protein
LRHSISSGDVAQRLGNERHVVTRLVKANLKVQRHVFFGLKMFGTIPFFQFLLHDDFLQLSCQRLRSCDVPGLGRFIYASGAPVA